MIRILAAARGIEVMISIEIQWPLTWILLIALFIIELQSRIVKNVESAVGFLIGYLHKRITLNISISIFHVFRITFDLLTFDFFIYAIDWFMDFA